MKTVNEQTLYELFEHTFSAVTADSDKMKGEIMEKYQISEERSRRRRRFLPLKIALASVLLLALSVTTYAAAVGGFAELLERVSLSFGDVVEPVSIVKEDEGIRLEVVAAQRYGDEAVLYMTLEDTTGQGRIDETTKIDMALGEVLDEMSYVSIGTDNLRYIEDIGKAVFETRVRSDDLREEFTISINKFATEIKELEPEMIEIDINKYLQMTGDPNLKNDGGGSAENLKSARLAGIPGTDNAYVSAVGISDGWFCVQTAAPKDKGYSIWPCLMDQDGNIIDSVLSEGDFVGKLGVLFDNISTFMVSEEILTQEAFFDIDVNRLDQYKIFYRGTQSNLYYGDWTLHVNLKNVEQAIIGTGWYESRRKNSGEDSEGAASLSGEITVMLNPLGLTVVGDGSLQQALGEEVELKTTDGTVLLQFGTSTCMTDLDETTSPADTKFEAYYPAKTPVNLDAVTEIWMDGNLIWKRES